MRQRSISASNDVDPAPGVTAALHAATVALVVRKTAVVALAALLALLTVQSVCIASLVGRAPRRIYVPDSTLLRSTVIEEESDYALE